MSDVSYRPKTRGQKERDSGKVTVLIVTGVIHMNVEVEIAEDGSPTNDSTGYEQIRIWLLPSVSIYCLSLKSVSETS